MPRETLRLLEQDLKRMLMAGSSLAASDGELRRRQQALSSLSSKVPILGKVAEQVGKVLDARPKQAAIELLNLFSVVMQLRATQTNTNAPAEKLRDAPKVEPLETPIAPAQLDLIWKAFQGQGKNRASVIEEAIEQKHIRDLRLLRPWIDLLDDSDWGDQVVEDVLPVLGKAAIAPLYQAFSLPGKAGDSRRLQGLVKLEGKAVEHLVITAIEKGSVELRETAIEALSALNPQELLARAPTLLKDRADNVRRAIIIEIAKHPSDETLALLISALRNDDGTTRWAAKNSLSTFEHPKRNATILALVTPELFSIKAPTPIEIHKEFAAKEAQKVAAAAAKKAGAKGAKAAKAPAKVAVKKAAKLTPAEQKEFNKREKEYNTQHSYAGDLIELIGECQIKEAAPLLLQIFQEKKHTFQEEATQALVALGDPKAMVEIAKRLDTAKGYDISTPLDAVFKMPPAQAFDTLAKYFEPKRLAEKGGDTIAQAILERFTEDQGDTELDEDEYEKQYLAEPRWTSLFLSLFAQEKLCCSAFQAFLYSAVTWQKISPEDFHEKMKPFLTIEKIESEVGTYLTRNIAETIEYAYDEEEKLFALPAWADFLALVVNSKNKKLTGARTNATEELVERNDPRAVPGLLRMLDASNRPWNLFEMLDTFKDSRIAPALLDAIQGKHKLELTTVYEAIRQQQDKAVLPTLQKMLLKKKRGKEADEIKKTIKHLEG
jgi:HEAT repeat protein